MADSSFEFSDDDDPKVSDDKLLGWMKELEEINIENKIVAEETLDACVDNAKAIEKLRLKIFELDRFTQTRLNNIEKLVKISVKESITARNRTCLGIFVRFLDYIRRL